MKKRFSLAVDGRDLASDHRGLGRYARAVVRELAARDDLELTLLVRTLLPSRARPKLEQALGSKNFRIASRISSRVDVAWHPWNGIFFRADVPHVATIADIAPFRFPDADPARREHQQAPFHDALKTARTIITISQASARDIAVHLHAQRAQIHVTYLGLDPIFTPGPAEELPEALRAQDYFLFVGEPSEPRKNFGVLFEAFHGAWPAGGPALAVLCRTDPALENVIHIPLAGDAGLRALYRGALATCVPALYEGFGMPALESMGCGTPVLAADASSLPEVCGDAAIMLDPHNVHAWREALQNIAARRELRERLRDLGLQQARLFNWKNTAEETLAIAQSTARLRS